MKFILILLLIIPACEYQWDIEVESMYNYEFQNDIQVTDLEDAVWYVAQEVEHKEEPSGIDYWQTPEETYSLKTGDCEDKAILLMYILQTKLNINSYLFLITRPNAPIGHAMAYADNLFIFAIEELMSEQFPKNYILNSIVPYSEAIWMAFHYHDNVGKYY